MPIILRKDGYKFFFYSDEHPPVHIHVKKGGAKAKIVLEPIISIDYNHGFKPKEIKLIVNIILENYQLFINTWHETFS